MEIQKLIDVKIKGMNVLGEAEKTADGYVFKNNSIQITVGEKNYDGVTVRRDIIKNITEEPLEIHSLLSRFVFNGGEYETYTQYSQWCMESKGAWQTLASGVFAQSRDVRQDTNFNPFFAVYNTQNQRGKVFHILADSMWQYKIYRNFIQQGRIREIYVDAGYSDFSYVLMPDEELVLPAVLYYDFKNKLDLDAYKLHRFVNKLRNPSLPVIYNTWMGVFDNISYDILMPQLEKAKYIGCEYFVIDAGWFGEKYKWFNSVGDWKEVTDCQMAGRMKEFADTVRANGLKFGLWFEIERAALQSKAANEHPEYYIIENGNAFVDFSNADAVEYIYGVLSANIRKYGIEFIKFDFNATLAYDKNDRAFIDYFKGYRAFIKRIREEFPEIYLENCASGGMRMALRNLEDFDSFWISDNHSLNAQLEIYKDTILRMPCNALEKWVTIRSVEKLASGRSAINVSGDGVWGAVEGAKESFLQNVVFGGPIGITCDLTALNQEHIELLKKTAEKHKSERAFWRQAEARILCNTESLTCIQYNDENSDKVKIFVFSKRCVQNSYTAYPVCAGNYKCGDTVYENISETGINILVPDDYSANVVELEKIKE